MSRASYHDQHRHLLEEEEGADFVSYDDDELQAASRLKRKRHRVRACLWISCGVFIIALIGVGLFFGTSGTSTSGFKPVHHKTSRLGKYKHAAVASDVTQCSQIGRDIMEKSDGNAVDASIASLLCMGLTDPQSMGIGGGFFMTIYNRTTEESWSIDARETAPINATVDMYYHNESSVNGGLAIAVPGEIRGYEKAWKLYGSSHLSWSDLFQPAIKMAKDGFEVPKSLENALNDFLDSHKHDDIKTTYPQYWKTYFNSKTGDYYKEGEILKLPEMAQTLSTLAKEGAKAFYKGSLTPLILEEFKSSGAIIGEEDLKQYKALNEESLKVTLTNGYTIHAPKSPSSGAILMFILNILDGYDITEDDVKTKEGQILTYHRILEAFKFAYAKRTDLADVHFWPNVTKLIANLTSRDYADSIRAMIWDNQTHPYEYYGPTYYQENKTSTAHLSVVDQFGNAVSVTSTVNTRFGSKVIGAKTGIVWNNEMDDFATSNKPNDFDVYPSPANKIEPGKRPLSSMCPAVFADKDGEVRLVLGAAGGSKITTATAYVAARTLWFGENIEQAIDALRLHHQLLPPEFTYETGFDMEIIKGLKAKGHNATEVDIGVSIVQGITRDGEFLYANSDYRKGGLTAGF